MNAGRRVFFLIFYHAYLRRGVYGEFEFTFFPVINAQTFHEQRRETGTGAAAKRMEYQEPLEARALISRLPDTVQHDVNDLLADGVMTARVIVGRVFFAGYQLLGMEKLFVPAHAHFICERKIKRNVRRDRSLRTTISCLTDNGGFQVDEHRSRHVFAGTGLAEERVETDVVLSLLRWHLAVRLNAMFQTIQFPASVTNLNTCLADVYGQTLALKRSVTPSLFGCR